MAESFVDSFKTELIADRVWRTRPQLELAIVEYISWFNDSRLHENLGDRHHARSSTQDAEFSPANPEQLVGLSIDDASIDEKSGELRARERCTHPPRSRSSRSSTSASVGHARTARCFVDDRIAPLVERDPLGEQLRAHPVRLARDRVDPYPLAHRCARAVRIIDRSIGREGRGSSPGREHASHGP
jgi:hypothetical protein